MVKSIRLRTWLLVAGLAFLMALLLLAAPAAAQEIEEYDFTVQEEYRIEIDETGDAAITDQVTYDPDWFYQFGYLFDEYPNLLSRRFRADTNVGELENFDVKVDTDSSAITVNFDAPGLVYYLGDEWVLYGYAGYQVEDVDDDRVVLSGSWWVTSEYTLFEQLPWEDTVIIEMPEGASDVRYDESDGAIHYQLPYTGETVSVGFLEENKTAMLIVFGVLMGLSLLLFIMVATRREKERPVQPAVAQAAPTGVPPAAALTPPTAPPTARAAPPTGAPPTAQAAPPEAQAAVPTYCKKCGQPTRKEGASFCKNCGTPFD